MSTKMYPVVQVYSGSDSVMSKSDIKRQAILESAYRLFRAQGFDGTSMAHITSEVGGSKATLYSHFPSKEELFVECMMAALENYMSDTLKHLDASRNDPEAALRKRRRTEKETALAARRAVAAFLRAYSPTIPINRGHCRSQRPHAKALPA